MISPESKQIDIRYPFLGDRVQKGAMAPSNFQVAGILTKSLAKVKFEMLRERFSLVENTFLVEREC